MRSPTGIWLINLNYLTTEWQGGSNHSGSHIKKVVWVGTFAWGISLGCRRGSTKVKVCPFILAFSFLLSLLRLTGAKVKVKRTKSDSQILAVAETLGWFGLLLSSSSNIDLQFFSFFESKVDVFAKFFIQFFLIPKWLNNYTWFLYASSWKATPKSKASFLSLKATPTQTYPPLGFSNLTAYPRLLSFVFTIAYL